MGSLIDDILRSGIVIENESICKSNVCQTEIEIIKRQLADCDKQIFIEKENYREALITNLRLDVEIERLESIREQKLNNFRYGEFEGQVSKETISSLNGFKNTVEDDSKFVMATLRDLYSENIELLKNKTATGKKTKTCDKTAVSPEKIQIIHNLFEKRLKYASGNDSVDSSRMKQLNKYIKSAIQNTTKNIP